jgi:hypothetical protein
MIPRRVARRHPAGARGLLETRGSRLSRFFAVALIALILLPFTAPFPTCELGGPQKSRPCDAVAKDKAFEDDLVPVASWSFVPPVLVAVAAIPSPVHPLDFERPHRTNLRL